ncbi:MAG: oxygen-independent coproporphyrinogen III oxidase [Bacteroidales bacterium]|nr:oxygen-independent coproporphyrinogen III oxidase [Bacteroidales bacterium]
MKIDNKLLEKYNVAVPRYTSYPPANHFSGGFTSADQETLLVRSNSWQPQHIALYVHIPFCKKICFYCGCNACKLISSNEVRSYIDALKKEIVMAARHINRDRRVTQLHFGGGTPNAIPAEMLTEIVELFRSLYTFAGNAEIAIETNPAYLDKPYLDALLQTGFNRFSFGIQDFDNDVLKMVNREPSAMPVTELMAYVKNGKAIPGKEQDDAAGGKVTVNLDFIYGLPGQTVKSFTATMQQAAELRPDRLVTFSYAHVPWLKKHQQILEKRGLPDPKQKTDMFLAGYKVMKNTGYEPIGLDHFVKKEDELYRALENSQLHRNFQGYCTRGTTGQVYAFGVTAISQLEKAYLQNTKSIKTYIDEIANGRFPVEKGMRVSDDQLIIREVITQLMCNKQLDWGDLAASLGETGATGKEGTTGIAGTEGKSGTEALTGMVEKEGTAANSGSAVGSRGMTADQLKKLVGYDSARLEEMQRDGLLEFDEERLTVTETGSMFIRNIAVLFDPAFSEQANKYSKSV